MQIRKRSRRRVLTCFLSVSLFLAAGLFAQELPYLTEDHLEALPADTHQTIREVYEQLRAGEQDSEKAGQMAQLFHAHGVFELAIPLYNHAHRLEPDKLDWIYLLSVAESADNKTEKSLIALQKALELAPDYTPAHFRMGELLQQKGKTGESLPHFLSVVEVEPDSAAAQFEVGKAYLDLGEPETAIPYLEKAVELFKGFGPAHYALVQAYRAEGNMELAKKHLSLYQENRLNKPFIDDPLLENVYRLKTGKILARDHVRKGIELGRMDRISEAIDEFNQALELDPENTSVFIDLMILYGRSKQYEEAQKLYSRAPEKVRESAELHYNYGVILVEAQQFQDAAEAFREMIRINPNDARAYNNIGQMLEKEGKFLDALDQYEAALKVDSQFRQARFNRARILIGQSQFAEAITELKQLLSPEDEATAQYTFVLSIAYVRSGDLENGLKYAEDALGLARKYNQKDLAKSIENNLVNLRKAAGNP